MPPRRSTAWLLAALLLGLYLYRNGLVVWPYLFRTPGDFGNYHRGAAALLRGESPFTAPELDYPPLLPVLLAPLGLLPLDGARVAWFFVSHGCLLGAAACLIRPLGGGLPALAAAGLLWTLGGTVQENLALGQVHPLLLLLYALALRADAERPAAGAEALGLAAGLKIWPGALLFAHAARRRWRALATGLAAAALAVLLPWLALAAATPPPHLPVSAGYWMGTPAPLNFSLPAAALRATYRVEPGAPLPHDWRAGNDAAVLRLAPWRRRLSAAVAAATLAAGLAALLARLSWLRSRGLAGPRDGLLLLAALTCLCLLASPISWYHYQLLQFPGLALLAVAYWNRRALLPLLGLAALAAGLTRTQTFHALLGGTEVERALRAGLVVPLLGAVLFVLLLAEMGREGSRA